MTQDDRPTCGYVSAGPIPAEGDGFTVGVVSYRTGPVLDSCLGALLAAAGVVEILVVDNGNPPEASARLDRLAAAEPRLRVIRPGRNLGFAAGCNLIAARARGRLLALVNPDLIVPAATFDALRACLDADPAAWLCGARLLNPDGSEQRGGRREVLTPWRALVETLRLDRLAPHHPHFRRLHLLDGAPPETTVAVPVISGALMAIRRDRFLALGGMDEAMFLHLEDIDFCLRVLAAGGRVLYCGGVPVHHHRGSSDVARWFVEWHKTRSSIRYFNKHFRATYPGWSLRLIALLLLARFALVAGRALPADFGRWLRRLGGGEARR
ncbi:MAG: hypothetical protein RLZZ501_985 [Pseudomonadota bacterium]|jgi:GT2 family glycosyltransferase